MLAYRGLQGVFERSRMKQQNATKAHYKTPLHIIITKHRATICSSNKKHILLQDLI